MFHNAAVGQSNLNKSLQQLVVSDTDQQVIFNGLPVELIQEIASYLPFPDLIPLKQTCKFTNQCIDSFMIQKAKARYTVEFRHMNKVEITEPDLYSKDMRRFYIDNNGTLVAEKDVIPDIKVVSLNFVIAEFSYSNCKIYMGKKSEGLNHALSIHIGQFNNGSCFILALKPAFSDRFLSFSKEHQMIAYFGDTHPTPWSGENNHSLYCGGSYEEAIKTFELACQGSDIANHIRQLLGFHKKYF